MIKIRQIALLVASASVVAPVAVAEQVSSYRAAIEEIVVTARKREESLQSVPVVVTAVGAQEIQRRGITNLDGISRIVPQLMIGPQGGSVQGGNISIRGISGPDTNPFGSEAVSFNIDGVQVAKGSVRRMSDTDIAQIEVLKGPQALFFGKNSPAGIVSIRTADPGDEVEAKISAGYEKNAKEIRTEGYISGPVSETVGFRVAVLYSTMDGYSDDRTPDEHPLAPGLPFPLATNYDKNPESDDVAIRATMLWTPDDRFDARLKLNYGEVETNGPAANTQFIGCPFGSRQTNLILGGAVDQPCGAGDQNINASSGPVVGTIPAESRLNLFGSGQNFSNQKQYLAGFEMNYQLSDSFKLTSVTGYYEVDLEQCQNYENDYVIALPSCNVLKTKDWSQELRLASEFEGPFNFYTGIHYSETDAEGGSLTYLFSPFFDLLGPGAGGLNTPVQVNNYWLVQESTAYSAYLQLSYELTEEIEITVGGRYSYEEKNMPSVRSGGGIAEGNFAGNPFLDASTEITLLQDESDWNDFSPEVSIAYRPTDDLTVFANYKEGFLSGGFNASSVNFGLAAPGTLDISYDQQTISGFELGVKSRLLDGDLQLNGAIYSYEIEDLQVVNFINASSIIGNAGAVEIDGIEVDALYFTPIVGLTLKAAASYNDGIYSDYRGAPCFDGQTPAQGCTLTGNGGAPVQNLSGEELVRAPDWDVTAGIDYEMSVGDSGMFLGFSLDYKYSSDYLTDPTSEANSRQPSYDLFDAGIRLNDADDVWQINLIARNLTDEHFFLASSGVPFTGGGTGTAGGAPADRFGTLNRGREIMLRASYKFF